jgi:gluconolactonase
MSTSRYYFGFTVYFALLSSACATSPAVQHSSSAEKAATPWSCPAQPGVAPKGNLVAARIPAANATRPDPGLYEGPVWIGDSLYFSDFLFSTGNPSRIMQLKPDGTVAVAIANGGSNGLAADNKGFLLAATHDRKAISRYNPNTGEREILVNEFEGNPFNSPNDLTATNDGTIYFTDPGYQRNAAPGGQPLTRVYRFKEGKVTVIDDSIKNPNGISLSPDQNTLYVAGGDGLYRYPITPDGVGKRTQLSELNGPDGMAIDCLGNIYATEHGQQRVRVFSPEGKQIATIKVDANITNAAFGGADRKTLYLTGAGSVWKIDLEVAGFPY